MDKFTGTHPHPVQENTDLTIVFEDAGMANQTVEITVSNGEGDNHTITITLDENGRGEHPFHVPGHWDIVNLNGGGSSEHTVPVTH